MPITIKAKFEWSGNGDLLSAKNLEKGGKVQMAIDNAVISYNIQYCPFATGTLARSPYSESPPGSGKVVYPGPYARYQYYGKVMAPSFPMFEDDSGIPTTFRSRKNQKKHLTDRDLTYRKDPNPLAGSFWFERMKADHMADILREAMSVAND